MIIQTLILPQVVPRGLQVDIILGRGSAEVVRLHKGFAVPERSRATAVNERQCFLYSCDIF